MNLKRLFAIVAVSLMVGSLAGCGTGETQDPEGMKLHVGLMPAVDAAPMLLAQESGYFEDLGIEVELEIFTSGQDRQSALQAGSIDGAMTDLVAVATNVDSGFDLKAVTMTNGVFPVLINENSTGKTDVTVGMMEVSVTNFLADQWLSNGYEVKKVYIDEIPARLAAIGSGQLDMGIFPEPVASMGELSGLIKEVHDDGEGVCPDVMVFTGAALETKHEAIALFLQACDLAAEDINDNPDLARDILMDNITTLDPAVRDMMTLPTYTTVSLPGDEYIESIISWTAGTIGKDLAVTPDDLVDRSFL